MKIFFWITFSLSIIFLGIIWFPKLSNNSIEKVSSYNIEDKEYYADTISIVDTNIIQRKNSLNNIDTIIKDQQQPVEEGKEKDDWKSDITFIIGSINTILAIITKYKPKKRKPRKKTITSSK